MIRIAREQDVGQMLSIYAPYILNTTHSFEYDVPTQEEFLARFRALTVRFPWLVWEEDGKILGYAYGSPPFERAAYSWCAESSIYLLPEAQGRGIGKRLYTALEKLLQYQGYQKTYAIITSENEGSLAFHKHLGYKTVGEFPRCGYKFGRWAGVIWMEKQLAFVQNPSEMPTLWSSIVENNRKINDILAILSLS